MKTKLIKLSDTHYIIVDDSEIKEGDFVYGGLNGNDIKKYGKYFAEDWKKITHSTQSIDTIILKNRNGSQAIGNHYGDIGYISLSEVEEAINEYSVEKMAKNKYENDYDNWDEGKLYWAIKGYVDGFKAHQELTKDKLFTIDDVEKTWKSGMEFIGEDKGDYDKLIQSIFPKTEWDIRINGKGKIIIL